MSNETHPFNAISDLPGFIVKGEWDADLEAIYKALVARRRILRNQDNAEAIATLKAGDTVTLGDIRPKYMIGAMGTITELNDTKVSIKLTSFRRRFVPGTIIQVPASGVVKCLESHGIDS